MGPIAGWVFFALSDPPHSPQRGMVNPSPIQWPATDWPWDLIQHLPGGGPFLVAFSPLGPFVPPSFPQKNRALKRPGHPPPCSPLGCREEEKGGRSHRSLHRTSPKFRQTKGCCDESGGAQPASKPLRKNQQSVHIILWKHLSGGGSRAAVWRFKETAIGVWRSAPSEKGD